MITSDLMDSPGYDSTRSPMAECLTSLCSAVFPSSRSMLRLRSSASALGALMMHWSVTSMRRLTPSDR